MALFTEAQRDDGDSIASFGFEVTGGACRSEYFVESIDAVNMQATITDILGYTETAVGSGPTLNRIPPRRHPQFPYLYASKINSIMGTGRNYPGSTAQNAVNPPSIGTGNPLNASPMTDQYRQYALYKIGVEFTGPRTYPIIQNGVITAQSGSWTRPDKTTQSYYWAPEFLRYTDFDFAPQDNTIQGQQGGMTLFNGAGDPPFTSPPWQWLPDSILKITWYQVPYRFILSSKSYIAASPWRGRVNQNYLWLWPPGELLYLSYNVKKYAPPTGYAQSLQNPTTGLFTYVNWSQLCDIELIFLLTKRIPGYAVGVINNANYVAKGHNLLPDLVNGGFYYATRNDSVGASSLQNAPPWKSAPLEVLFSDPDCGGGPDLV